METERDNAKKITELLDEGTATLDRAVLDRLYAARVKAVARLAEQHQMAAASAGGPVLQLMGDYLQRHRMLVPAALVAGAALVAFTVTQQVSRQHAIEHGDAFLLSAELPPEAFLDKGFDTWLRHTSQQ